MTNQPSLSANQLRFVLSFENLPEMPHIACVVLGEEHQFGFVELAFSDVLIPDDHGVDAIDFLHQVGDGVNNAVRHALAVLIDSRALKGVLLARL